MNDSASKAVSAPDDDAGPPVPRHGRASLLRLARWFEAADAETAHAIHTAAFATYQARHLSGQGSATAATTSWWNAPLADTAAAKLAVASSVAPVPDHTEQRVRLRDEAEASAHWRRSAAREVRRLLSEPTREDSRLHLTPAALGILMDLLTAALGSGDAARGAVSAGDLELDIRLQVTRVPTASVVLSGTGGDLTIDGLRLQATSYADGAAVPDGSDASNPQDSSGDQAGSTGTDPPHSA